jgi:hypothetical protein
MKSLAVNVLLNRHTFVHVNFGIFFAYDLTNSPFRESCYKNAMLLYFFSSSSSSSLFFFFISPIIIVEGDDSVDWI